MSEQASVTLTTHSQKSGQGAKGPWTLNKFSTADGTEFATFQAAIANQTLALLGKPAIVTFESETNQKGYTNRTIVSIEAASAEQAASVPPPAPTPHETAQSSKDERYNRGASLNTAVELLKITGGDLEGAKDLLAHACVVLAPAIEQHVRGETKVQQQQASTEPTV